MGGARRVSLSDWPGGGVIVAVAAATPVVSGNRPHAEQIRPDTAELLPQCAHTMGTCLPSRLSPLKWQPTNNLLRGSVVGHQAENADQAHANCLTARLDLARRPRHRLALIA